MGTGGAGGLRTGMGERTTLKEALAVGERIARRCDRKEERGSRLWAACGPALDFGQPRDASSNFSPSFSR
ncbi:hypothetical protein GMST_17460 [Geomonas silvestris]|uniref:Uncharacterized protein n=1 Tax=Geomonas silvestris TaxID=2740184 RepID=A0A6V8MHF0_9BACT|nr:hypothetical protein GMST_17460 [Geomonas silvestris]